MASFYLMTKTGSTPPRYVHDSMQSALTEAKRLHALTNDEVMILEVIGKVISEEVPVTKTVVKTVMIERYSDDDLPF